MSDAAREALVRIVDDYCAKIEADAGRGHDGTHDHEMRMGQPPDTAYPPSDCLQCVGQRYGADAALADTIARSAASLDLRLEGLPYWFVHHVEHITEWPEPVREEVGG